MGKYVDMIGWDDCPHLMPPVISQEERDTLESRLQPHQREARKKGRPSLGAGAIYPVPEEDIFVPPFAIPDFWPRAYGLDVGWNRTACIWGAMDPEPEKPVFYMYHEYYRAEAEPIVHSAAIKGVGEWINGAIDSAANGRSQYDGKKVMTGYINAGLHLTNANKAIEAGLDHALRLMQTGRLKIFDNLGHTKTELRLYRRNEKGAIVKENDHLMDALRYLLFTANIFKTQAIDQGHKAASGRGEF
jgi:hypothetical protein